MIRSLELINCGPYRGEHRLHFQASIYAFIAQYEIDRDRSNWGGKSFLFESIAFAMTGQFSKLRKLDADGWITHGESHGLVRLIFGDGVHITREKNKGKPLQISFVDKNGHLATQSEAERALFKYLLFNEEDFSTVAYFEQGHMARIIHTQPEKRLSVVRGWLNLEDAEKAEKKANEAALSRIKSLQKLQARREVLIGLDTSSPLVDLETLEKTRRMAQRSLKELEAEKRILEERYDLEDLVEEHRAKLNEKKRLLLVQLTPEVELDTQLKDAREKYDFTVANHRDIERKIEQTQSVATGTFNGKCPVASIRCPATSQINGMRDQARAEIESSHTEMAKSDKANRIAQTLVRTLEDLKRKQQAHVDQIERLHEETRKSKKSFLAAKFKLASLSDDSSRAQEIDREIEEVAYQIRETTDSIAKFNYTREQREKTDRELKELEETIASSAKSASVAIKARSVFKATQRRLAERALNHIGVRANKMLSDALIDLRIDIQWEKEGKKYAKHCEMCGASFPASNKVKECEACGAERGLHIVHKLEFLLSDRSGAADDLGGLSLQLSAGSWLLRRRHSPWATALIDEPFGKMDKTIRRAVSTQLVSLVGTSSFHQAFVISHSQETIDMYPHTVLIHVAKDGTRRIEQS